MAPETVSPTKRRPPNAGKGRKKGVPNRATREIKVFAQRLLFDRKYRIAVKKRLIEGTAPHLETLLHHYAYGKPTEYVEHSGGIGGAAVNVAIYLPANGRD